MRVDALVCSHGATLNVIDAGPPSGREVVICTGLTSNIAPGSTSGHLADALAAAGWASRRFDYCGSLDPVDQNDLRTMDRMSGDIASVLSTSGADVVIARGRAAQPALRAITPAIRHLVLWAPIIWVEAPHSTLKDTIMAEVDRNGFAMIDGTRVGREFLHALNDPTDNEVASWVRSDCRYTIVHPQQDEVHALALTRRLADIMRSAGGNVQVTVISGVHPNIQAIPHEQIDAVVAALR